MCVDLIVLTRVSCECVGMTELAYFGARDSRSVSLCQNDGAVYARAVCTTGSAHAQLTLVKGNFVLP